MSKPEPCNLPPSKAEPNNDRGYRQIYLIRRSKFKSSAYRNVYFRCGTWCYSGEVAFDFLTDDDESGLYREINLRDVPKLIPSLQSQQDDLSLLGCASHMPPSSGFDKELQLFEEAEDFLSSALSHPQIRKQLEEWKEIHEWIDQSDNSYFELIGDVAKTFKDVQVICAKRYINGLVFVTIYFESVFYTVIQDGSEDQPLLDVKFPDISSEGEGFVLATYDEGREKGDSLWRKLSMWRIIPSGADSTPTLPTFEPDTRDLSSDAYVQSYIVMKPSEENMADIRKVLFRFGSWCYSGSVELIPELDISDIPYVIPALRLQQNRLEFLCDASKIPVQCPFAAPLRYASDTHTIMEKEVSTVENALRSLMERLGNEADDWLDGDPSQSFFEFSLAQGDESLQDLESVDLIATKTYNPNGIVTISLYFERTHYLSVRDASEDQPLLDSKFPSILQGRGYQIKLYPTGTIEWPQLRRLAIWQTAESMLPEANIIVPNGATLPSCNSPSEEKEDFFNDMTATSSESKDGDNVIRNIHAELEGVFATPLDEKRPCKGTFDRAEAKGAASHFTPPSTTCKETALEKDAFQNKRNSRNNFGAFHHLPPMKSTSKLECQMKGFKEVKTSDSSLEHTPWDHEGRPLRGAL